MARLVWIILLFSCMQPGGEFVLPSRLVVTDDQSVAVALDDLKSTQNPTDIRYVSLGPVNNAGITDSDLEIYRQAYNKLVHGLSWITEIKNVKPIDIGETIFRLDLRQFRDDIWPTIEAIYPYALDVENEPNFHELEELVESPVPIIRLDWFVYHASQPPLYHTLLGLPDTEAELEDMLMINVPQGVALEIARRAGLEQSNVSFYNRIVERHETPFGGYWKSYDFTSSKGQADILEHPLGPSDIIAGGFEHAGGEIIFNLPNGMQAYMLSNATGGRIDTAPPEIVIDPGREDLIIRNGLSCFTCHHNGLIDANDNVRAKWVEDDSDYGQSVLALYAPVTDLRKLMDEDSGLHQTTLQKIGVDEGPDPIYQATEMYLDRIIP